MKLLYNLMPVFLMLFYGCSGNEGSGKIEASGSIEATYVTVSSKISGEILELLKDEGDNVHQGDTVMIIDHETSRLLLRQAQAGLKIAEAQLNMLLNGARKEDLQYAEEMLRQAEVNKINAENDKKRLEKLLRLNTVTEKQFEDASSRYELTSAQYNAARENLNKLKNFARPEEKQQANANVERSRAAAELLQKNINDSYVTSPVNGTISRKYFERGETVNQMAALFKVVDLQEAELVIYISELELGKVKLGQDADIKTDTYPDKTYRGKVIFIAPEAEFTPKNIQTQDERTKLVFGVKIKIPNPQFELKPGMPADAVIYID